MVSPHINTDEANLYDRQIRLWGLNAQNRLRNASVLLIGMNTLGAEIAKNLTLTGVKRLHLVDDRVIRSADDCHHFLMAPFSPDIVGQKVSQACLARCKHMNPLVETKSVDFKESIDKLLLDDDYDESDKENVEFTLGVYDLICVIDFDRSRDHLNLEKLQRMNQHCRRLNVKFVLTGCFGWFGYTFYDFQRFEYVEESATCSKSDADKNSSEPDEPETKKLKKSTDDIYKQTEFFVSLSEALKIDVTLENRKKWRKTPNGFCILQILNEFCEKFERCPTNEEDLEEIASIKRRFIEDFSKLIDFNQFDLRKFDPSVLLAVSNPVCAILGGVTGQHIIQALSQNEKPINNFFFYDSYDGLVCKFPIQ